MAPFPQAKNSHVFLGCYNLPGGELFSPFDFVVITTGLLIEGLIKGGCFQWIEIWEVLREK